MIPGLEPFAHPTPAWLKRLRPADIAGGPLPYLKHLVEDALVYPGAGVDGSPVRQCNGVIHSFIFLDYFLSLDEIQEELTRERRTGTGFAHHRLVGLVAFDASPIVTQADPNFMRDGENHHRAEGTGGIWAVFESIGPGPTERFSFLFMHTEAIQTLAALFPVRPPRAIVVQEHGFGGNCWNNFSDKLLELSELWNDTPEFLILGPNHRLHKWRVWGQSLGTDIARESMHHNEREVLFFGEKARRLCLRGINPHVV